MYNAYNLLFIQNCKLMLLLSEDKRHVNFASKKKKRKCCDFTLFLNSFMNQLIKHQHCITQTQGK